MSKSRWLLAGTAAIGGMLVLPVLGYVAGGRLVGPYAGPRGLASYLGSIYGDALAGHPLALMLVLAPGAIVGVWLLRAGVLHRMREPASGGNS
ncbi:MAG: hypothetical protein IT486_07630 [Gammaproteobacteria bacterium]|nr:hypothetical protein [Gammaproteobacteria bacterium]